MNIPIAMTLKGFTNSQNLDYVPANGELLIDKETNLLKIGDGKTSVKALPYVSGHAGVDLATAKADKETVPDYVRQIIKKYSNLIEENRFNELLDNIIPSAHTGVVRTLLEAGIDVKSHLFPIPDTVKHLFEEAKDWSIDLDRMYTKTEIDAKLHEVTEEFTKKMYLSMGIPAHLMTIKTGEN